MLLLYFHTQNFLGDNYFLEEPLGPSLGIQAQLPVLLAEYAFYKDQDITDYLNLLSDVDSYFKSILEFEQQKAQAGYFMSDATLDRILKQCSDFIKDPESNYMLEIFQQKLEDYGKLSEADQQILIDKHKEILLNKVIPAYQMLMDGLEKLRGTGTVTKTMMKNVAASFVNGDIEVIEYPSEYCFAVKFTSKTGVPYNIADIQAMIEEIKPAHLAVEYIFTYRLWQDIIDEIQIWTAAKNYSWEWLLTFEVKSNLNISDSGIFYCPDGNGNGKVIWNSSKAYARRNE